MARRKNRDQSHGDVISMESNPSSRNSIDGVVQKSILDWDFLNRPDSVMGHSFTFVAVMYIFTIGSYAYWMVINNIPFFKNLVPRNLINGEILEVAVLDLAMCASSLGSYFIVKSAKNNIIPLNKAHYVYTLWILTWTISFLSKAYKYEWSWSRYALFSPHLFTILMKQHAYYVSNVKMLKGSLKLENKMPTSKSSTSKVTTSSDKSYCTKVKIPNFPNNINIFNYLQFLSRPVFVYRLYYPSSERIRTVYILWKGISLVLSIAILYVIVQYVVAPLLDISNNLPLLGGALLLSVPTVFCHMLIFYIMFEVIANIFAEITKHADRDFYGVWWGSGDFRQFCRNWNKPVNKFLNTYVYKELRSNNLGHLTSLSITFLISAVSHEIVMFTVCRSLSPYIFVTMILLVPVLVLESLHIVQTPYIIALFRYWVLFFSYLPMLAILYYRSYNR